MQTELYDFFFFPGKTEDGDDGVRGADVPGLHPQHGLQAESVKRRPVPVIHKIKLVIFPLKSENFIKKTIKIIKI